MSNLYIIGGSPRAGKTTVSKDILSRRPMPFVSTDALRFGVRSALFDEPYVTIDELHFEGTAEFRRPGSKKQLHATISRDISEDELTWKAAVGLIDHYDRTNEDFMVEGMIFTPEDVAKLKLANLSIKAVFMGYSDVAHVDTILTHAKNNPHDWINVWLAENDNDETELREWAASEVAKSQTNAQLAEKYGYGYFDITSSTFDEHITAATAYLLQ